MDNSMVEVLLAQGIAEQEAFKRISLYYQMLSEGRSRIEARSALRCDGALDYLGTLVRTAIGDIVNKGFQPEEVEDAIHEYYHPRREIGFRSSAPVSPVSANPLDDEIEEPEVPEVVEPEVLIYAADERRFPDGDVMG